MKMLKTGKKKPKSMARKLTPIGTQTLQSMAMSMEKKRKKPMDTTKKKIRKLKSLMDY